jgi:hypothetical protein
MTYNLDADLVNKISTSYIFISPIVIFVGIGNDCFSKEGNH